MIHTIFMQIEQESNSAGDQKNDAIKKIKSNYNDLPDKTRKNPL
jgi:hypothetical protein